MPLGTRRGKKADSVAAACSGWLFLSFRFQPGEGDESRESCSRDGADLVGLTSGIRADYRAG